MVKTSQPKGSSLDFINSRIGGSSSTTKTFIAMGTFSGHPITDHPIRTLRMVLGAGVFWALSTQSCESGLNIPPGCRRNVRTIPGGPGWSAELEKRHGGLGLRFLRSLGSRLRGSGLRGRGWLAGRASHRIGGVVAPHYFFGNVDVLPGVVNRNLGITDLSVIGKNRRHCIQDRGVAVLFGKILNHATHLLADAAYHIAAVGREIILRVLLRSSENLLLFIELAGKLGLGRVAGRGLLPLDLIFQTLNILLHLLQLSFFWLVFLIQVGHGFLAFSSVQNRCLNIQEPDLARSRASRRALGSGKRGTRKD